MHILKQKNKKCNTNFLVKKVFVKNCVKTCCARVALKIILFTH